MKARVIETGEIIEVQSLYPITYSRLDCNGKIIEEYDEDELEFIPNPNRSKMVTLDKVCKCLEELFTESDENPYVVSYQFDSIQEMIEDLRKEFE